MASLTRHFVLRERLLRDLVEFIDRSQVSEEFFGQEEMPHQTSHELFSHKYLTIFFYCNLTFVTLHMKRGLKVIFPKRLETQAAFKTHLNAFQTVSNTFQTCLNTFKLTAFQTQETRFMAFETGN